MNGVQFLSATHLMDEVKASQRWIKAGTKQVPEMIAGYHGGAWRGQGSGDHPENHAFEWLSLMLGRAVYNNPRIKVSDVDGDEDGKVVQDITNEWVLQTNPRPLVQRMFVDFSFCYAPILVTNDVAPGWTDNDDPPFLPKLVLLQRDRFGWDSQAQSLDSIRFAYHIEIEPKDRLLDRARENKDEGWNLAEIEKMPEIKDLDEVLRPNKDAPNRGEVAYFQVWTPEIDPDLEDEIDDPDLYGGTLYTLPYYPNTKDGDVQSIRKPRLFFGPASGPYTIIGCYTVPGSSMPLAQLMAVYPQTLEFNAYAKATQESAARQKTITLLDSMNDEEAARIVAAEDGEAVKVAGLDATKIKEISTIGVSEQRILILQMLKDRLERVSGFSEQDQGNVGTGTATAQTIASSAGNTRSGFSIQRFQDGFDDAIRKIAWFLVHEPRTVMRMRDKSLYVGGKGKASAEGIDLAIKLGIASAQEGAQLYAALGASKPVRFADIVTRLHIEAYSMERTNENLQQLRLMQGSKILLEALPMIPMFPNFDWKTWLNKQGEALNWPDMGSLIFADKTKEMSDLNMQILQGQAQIANQAPQGQPQQGAPQPGPRPMTGFPGNASGAKAGAAARVA